MSGCSENSDGACSTVAVVVKILAIHTELGKSFVETLSPMLWCIVATRNACPSLFQPFMHQWLHESSRFASHDHLCTTVRQWFLKHLESTDIEETLSPMPWCIVATRNAWLSLFQPFMRQWSFRSLLLNKRKLLPVWWRVLVQAFVIFQIKKRTHHHSKKWSFENHDSICNNAAIASSSWASTMVWLLWSNAVKLWDLKASYVHISGIPTRVKKWEPLAPEKPSCLRKSLPIVPTWSFCVGFVLGSYAGTKTKSTLTAISIIRSLSRQMESLVFARISARGKNARSQRVQDSLFFTKKATIATLPSLSAMASWGDGNIPTDVPSFESFNDINTLEWCTWLVVASEVFLRSVGACNNSPWSSHNNVLQCLFPMRFILEQHGCPRCSSIVLDNQKDNASSLHVGCHGQRLSKVVAEGVFKNWTLI